MKYDTWTEITPEKAKLLWETKSIFAFQEWDNVHYQINGKDSKLTDLDEAVSDGCTIFIEN